MKKVVSLLLALVLIFAMSSVAMAADEPVAISDFNGLKTAFANGGDYVLNGNITVDAGESVTVAKGKTVTIDLAGYKISGTFAEPNGYGLIMIENTATLTVTDSSAEKTGEITNHGSGLSTIHVSGTFHLYDATISQTGNTSLGFTVDVRPNSWGDEYTEGSLFHMHSGKVTGSDSTVRVASSSADTHDKVSASFIMDGGILDSAWDGVLVQQSNAVFDVLNVEINNGEITADKYALRVAAQNFPSSTLIESTGSVGDAEVPTNVTINGGTVNGDLVVKLADGDEETMDWGITGGTFTDEDALDYMVGEDVEYEVDENGNIVITTPTPEEPEEEAPKAAKRYDIKVADTKNGDVTVKGSASYDSGVIITAAPHYGYEVGKVTVTAANGKEVKVTNRADGTYSFSMPRGEVSIKVTFVPQGEAVKMVLTIGSKTAIVDGAAVESDVAPVIKAGRTFLPIRLIAENLGAKVEWNNDAQTVTITKGETVIVLTIGSTTVTVNGQPTELEAAVFIESSRTFLPVRFIAEKLGADVEWNGATNEVTISGRK